LRLAKPKIVSAFVCVRVQGGRFLSSCFTKENKQMDDEPKEGKPEPLPFVQSVDSAIQVPIQLHLAASTMAAASGHAFFVYAPPSDGYVPDPHDDPTKLLELIMASSPLPRGSEPWPCDLSQQIDLIYKLAGELGSRISEVELGWYLILISLMPQTPRQIIDAIINSKGNPNGGQQRSIIWAVMCAIFPDETSDFRSFFKDLLTATNNLQSERNAAIHSIIKIGPHQGHSRIIVPLSKNEWVAA
jgi:hypothetical protein